MASNNGTVGKWEVVKKGKKNPNSGGKPGDKKSGGGERKVLTESNLFTRRKCTRPTRQLICDPHNPFLAIYCCSDYRGTGKARLTQLNRRSLFSMRAFLIVTEKRQPNCQADYPSLAH
jgi:hypothetical protein